MRTREQRDTEEREPSYERATLMANGFVWAIREIVQDEALGPKGQPQPEDVLFGLAMALAYLTSEYGAVEKDVMKVLRKCLDAPIHHFQKGAKPS